MSSSLPSLTYVYKEDNLNKIQLKNFQEAWDLLKLDEATKLATKEEILRTKIYNNNALYVLSVFDGEVFEHLRSIKARVVSSHCLLHSHRANRRLPRSKVCPLYSLSMTNLVVCCTNIEKNIRQEIYDKVEMMNGRTSRVFTNEVTHLITTEVGSAKYHAAGDMKKSIMLPTWVLELWDLSLEYDVNGNDEKFLMKHRCPLFNKYVICASGFSADIKSQIKSLVESEGGTYQGDLVCGTTTHLVINEAKGDKYNYAKLWKISIVNSKWIYDSIDAKYCLPEKAYQLETTASTSTPTNKSILGPKTKTNRFDIDVSMIANTTTRNLVNETEDMRLSCSNLHNQDNTMSTTTVNAVPANLSKYSDILKELNSIGKIKSILFDGLGIYCDGFDASINEKLKKILNSGGAIRFEDFNSDVTHVIVNQLNEKKCKNYVDNNPEINILSIDWLIDTCRQNELADCKNYFVYKNALNSVKTPKKRMREENQKTLANTSVAISMKGYENDLNSYLSQYLAKDGAPCQITNKNETTDKRPILQEADLNQISSVGTTTMNPQSTTNNNITSNNNNSSLQLINAEKAHAQKLLFSNKVFTILGFEVDEVCELKELIESMGGSVNDFEDVDDDESEENEFLNKPADYILLPMTITQPLNVATTATVFWLRKCIEQNIILPLNEHVLFQPIPRYNTDRALTGCVVTISGYVSYEKETISNLCQLIGAVAQAALSSKHAKNIFPNTHLICKTPEGPKYTAAKTWNLPTVSIEWLVDSCVSGVKADESKYSIDLGTKHEEFIKNLDKIRRNITDSQQNQTKNTTMNTTELISCDLPESTVVPQDQSTKIRNNFSPPSPTIAYRDDFAFESPKNSKANDSSLLGYSASKKPRLENETTHCTPDVSVSQSNKPSTNNDSVFKTPIADNVFKTPQAVDKTEVFAKKNLNKTPLLNSQEQLSTPPCNPRLREIRKSGIQHPNSNFNTPQSTNGGNESEWPTPVWMKSPNDPKRKNFECRLNIDVDVDKVMELLRTPNPNGGPPLTPLHELNLKCFRVANENGQIPGFYDFSSDTPEIVYSFEKKKLQEQAEKANNHEFENQNNDEDDDIPATPLEAKELKEVLKNIKVYVSKKLAKNQAELNNIVETLGGDFIWIYNQTCTHVIYSGKANDNNKELRLAKEQNKIIVSPYWLYACQEQKQRVDESLYPYTYNPSKCAVVTSRTPKVSLSSAAHDKGPGTPVSANTKQQEFRQSQQLPPRSQVKKTTTQNIIKNYCSDEDEDEEIDEENLLATNRVNLRLLKKRNNSNQNLAEAANRQQQVQAEATNTATTLQQTVANNCDNDSEMNLIDSQFIRNCDKQCKAAATNKNEQVADIPDSIDIKNDFLNQLQDKLANIRTNNSVSNNPGFATPNNNNNNNNNSNSNLNTSQSMLNEHQIMNELNKSGRSKWGNSINNDSDEKKMNEKQDDDLLCVRILDDNNSRDSNYAQQNNEDDLEDLDKINLKQLNINKNKQNNKYSFNNNKNDIKKRRQFLNKGDDDDDDVYDVNKNNEANHVAPSQIQVTLWKEEQQQHQTTRRKNDTISDRLTNYYKN